MTDPTVPAWVAAARRMVLDHSPVGFAVLDAALRYVEVNEVLADLHGVPVADHVGRGPHEVVPGLAEAVVRPYRQVLATGRPLLGSQLSGTVAGTPGTLRHWIEDIHPVIADDGRPPGVAVGVVVLVREVTDRWQLRQETVARALAEGHARRTRLLQRLTGALGTAVDTAQVAEVVTATVAEALQAQASILAVLDDGRWRLLAATGMSQETAEAWQAVVTAPGSPLTAVLHARRPTVFTSLADRCRQYPQLRGTSSPNEAVVLLPLHTDDQPAGLVGFGWHRPRAFTPDDVELLTAVAGQTAVALERARLFDAERRARAAAERAQHRLRLLAEASDRLTTGATETDRLAGLADLLVDGFADWCVVLLPDDADRLHRRVVSVADPALRRLAVALTGTAVDDLPDGDPRHVAWRTGRVAQLRSRDMTRHVTGVDAALADRVAAAVGAGAILAAPLVAHDETIGVFSVWRHAGRPRFDADDEYLLADLGRRAGTAVDNLRLLAARTHVAARLQDTLLPAQLPAIPGVELAAGYLVAEDAADVGGDLYDAFPVDDGYALIIGDVAGRGVDAAGLTGLTRATLRALAGQLSPPAALARLNTLLAERSGHERFLTLAYLLLHPSPDGARLEVWRAGHPPPQLVRADATVTDLGVPGPLLGAFQHVAHAGRTYQLAPGDLLLLYTDGLLEARTEAGMFGEVRLPRLLPTLAGGTASDAVTRLEQAVIDQRVGGADDTALLAVRLTPPGEPTGHTLLDRRLPVRPATVALGRQAAGRAIAALFPPRRAHQVLVAVSELLTHAVRQAAAHPPRGLRLDQIRLRITTRGPELRVEVYHPGARSTACDRPDDQPVTGHARDLLRAVATDRGTTSSGGTTCLWFETAVPSGGGARGPTSSP